MADTDMYEQLVLMARPCSTNLDSLGPLPA